MYYTICMLQRGSDAFILVEIVIVLAIIGGLSYIAARNMPGTPKNAEDVVIKSDLSQMRTLAHQAFIEDNTYATAVAKADGTEIQRSLVVLSNDLVARGAMPALITATDKGWCVSTTINISPSEIKTMCLDKDSAWGTVCHGTKCQ